MKQQVRIFPVEIYNRGVCVFFGTREQFKAYASKEEIKLSEEDEQILDGSNAVTFRLPNDALIFSEREITEWTLIHEIEHATKHILRCCDITDEEAECYLLAYLCKEIVPWAKTTSFLA